MDDGTSIIPRNRVNHAKGGQDVIYWIQWKEPVDRSRLRCVVTGPDTNIDETENFASPAPEGYSACAIETEEADDGVFTFTQYLDDEKVGELSISKAAAFLGSLAPVLQGERALAAVPFGLSVR